MNRDGHPYLGNTEHLRNLQIAETFKKSECKNLRRPWLQLRQSPRQRMPQLARIFVWGFGRQIGQFDRPARLPRPDHIQGRVDGRPAQVTLFIFQNARPGPAAEQAQKHGLRNVLGIRGVARNPVRRAEDEAVIGLKYPVEFGRDCDCRCLCQCAQGTPPIALL